MIDKKMLGESCRNLRKQLNITQEDFADAAGVTRQTVINFENGKSNSFKLLEYFLSLRPDLMEMILGKTEDQTGSGAIEVLIITVLVVIVAFLIISMGV